MKLEKGREESGKGEAHSLAVLLGCIAVLMPAPLLHAGLTSKQLMNTPDTLSVERWWVLVLVLVPAVEGFVLISERAPNFSRWRWSQAAENTIRRRIQPLRMGKGFNSAKSKQLELAKKMALAKKQQQSDEELQKGEEATPANYDEEEQRLRQDRARFAELLRTIKVSNPNPLYEDDELDDLKRQSRGSVQSSLKASVTARAGALNAKRSKSNISTKTKQRQKKDKSKTSQNEHEDDEDRPLQEGDIARRHDFEGLVSCETGAALGPIVSAQLVPWVPPFTAEYLVILADPRAQSSDLRRTIQYISSNVSPNIFQQVIAINSDEVSITKSWVDRAMTQQGDDGSGTEGDAGLIRIFSDRNWEWMRRYSAVDDGRWSMSMMVIDGDAVIRKVIRDVDPSQVCQVLAEAIESIK